MAEILVSALIGALAKFLLALWQDRRREQANVALGRAESDAEHAAAAAESDQAMQAIADKPIGGAEIRKRLKDGSA